MIWRRLLMALSAVALCAAETPPPPAQLQPYIKNGRFDPGDFAWIKGRFQDATPAEATAFRAIMAWSSACRNAALKVLRAELAARGYPDAAIDTLFPGPLLCRQVASQPLVYDNSSYSSFAHEVASVEPVVQTFIMTLRQAEQAAAPQTGADLARMLQVRPIGEQILRGAVTWAPGPQSLLPLSAMGQAIFRARISVAIAERDDANTEWLKGIVRQRGWPKISEVGEEAASQAWLLVQHADHDPLFQLEALRLMEPMVAQGEVSKRNFAYLYDRAMLKLAGKQRYATQVRCTAGVRRPLPLESEADVDRLRAEMGLEPVSEYIERFNRDIPCEGLPENNLPQ